MLVRLLYASKTSHAIDQIGLDQILQGCRRNNPTLGITGVLCYGNNVFLQLLEGGRAEVNQLYNTISRDPRHQEVQVLLFEEISERCFGGWTMGLVNLARINPALVLRFSERPLLDPFAMPGKASMALLTELVATAQVAGRGDKLAS
jgi:hypothetical protein